MFSFSCFANLHVVRTVYKSTRAYKTSENDKKNGEKNMVCLYSIGNMCCVLR